jgi:hypothetical protein
MLSKRWRRRLVLSGLYWTRVSERFLEVIEKMERETGVEPATSSLGNWANIVNTDFSVSGSDFRRPQITEFPSLCSELLLLSPA